MSRHEPTRALTTEEAEDRPERRNECKLSLCHIDDQERVWRPDAECTCYRLVEPGSRWSGETYYEQSLLDAAGPGFVREVCCLQRNGIMTVGEFAAIVKEYGRFLDGRFNTTTGKKPNGEPKRAMFIQRERLQALCLRLEEARLEFNEWRGER